MNIERWRTDSRSVLADTAVAVAALLVAVVATTLPPGEPLRVVLTLPPFLLVPGYAVTLALFPAARSRAVADSDRPSPHVPAAEDSTPALAFTTRLALAFGLSVVSFPLFAMAIAVLQLPYTSPAVVVAATVLTLPVLAVGTVRRLGTPVAYRYTPVADLLEVASRWFHRPGGVDYGLNVALAVAVVLSAGALTFGVAAPQDGSSYTQVSLLTPDAAGNVSASGYPRNVTSGESAEMILAVTNREDTTTAYTVVVQAQTVDDDAVTATSELERFESTVPVDETWRVRHDVTLTRTGDDRRVAYLVYRGDAPATPRMRNAYRTVYFWTNVSARTDV